MQSGILHIHNPNFPTVYCPIQNHKAQSDEIEPALTGAHFIVNFVFVMSPAEWQPIIASFPSEISVISTIYAFCKNSMGKNIEEPLACCRTIPHCTGNKKGGIKRRKSLSYQ